MSTAKLFNSGRYAPRFRIKMALAFVAVVAVACAVAAALLLWRAAEERADLRQHALSEATALSNALDQEVAAMNYLLKGLSSSPALRSGDLRGFYDQLLATAIPEGSWLILHDLEGQVLNTLRPFGAALPRHSEFPTSPVERVREKGWSVSGRTASRLKPGALVVGLSLRVESEGQPLKHFLTTIVSDVRLRQVMLELRLRGAHTSAFDRDVQPLFSSSGSLVSDRNVVDAVRARLAGAQRERAIETLLDAADENGNPVLVGLRRSASTDWTSVTVTPGIEIQQPVRRALTQICAAFAFLLLIGGLAAYYMSRQVEGPLDAARQEVDDLSEQLLVLQEDERRRIALELHDSTAQHLVAGKLGLMQIVALADGNPAIRKVSPRLRHRWTRDSGNFGFSRICCIPPISSGRG